MAGNVSRFGRMYNPDFREMRPTVCKVCNPARSWWPVAGGQWPVGGAPTVCKVCHSARRTPNWQLATGDWPPATVCKVCNSARRAADRGPGYSFGAVRSMRVSRAAPWRSRAALWA